MAKQPLSKKAAALAAKGKKDFAVGGVVKKTLEYSPIKRAGDKQLMQTKDSDRFYAKKNMDKKIDKLQAEISLDLLPNSVQEGNTPEMVKRMTKKADVAIKQLDSLKAIRKRMK